MISTDFWQGKRVFLTGHTGFKGGWLSIWLHLLGAKVTGYALEPPTSPSLFKKANIEELLSHNIGDIRDLDKLKKIMIEADPEIVIHMAAQPLVRESYNDPVGTYQTNVMGTVHVLESIRSCKNIRAVVNVTTDKCYENKEWLWGYREDEPMGGYDPYSNSKGCSELVTSSYRRSFFNADEYGKSHQVAIASARAGNVIGGGDYAKDRLIPDIIKSFENKEIVSIRSPHSIRPWQHVLEPLSGYLTLAEALYSKNGIDFAQGWNLGPNSDDAKPVQWIAEKMCDQWGEGASYVIEKNPQPHEATYLKLDISKAETLLLWHPSWDLEKTLSSIISWVKMEKNMDVLELSINQIKGFNSIGDK
jgi:CDP-glucose 4,6-dehydratase